MARSNPSPRRLALFAAASGALAACNVLIGVSEYDKSDCEPLCDAAVPSLDASGGPDAEADARIDAADPGEPSLLTRWARWPMPNSADASLPNPPRYATDGGAVVLDEVTKLEWAKVASSSMSYEEAVTHCANLLPQRTWRVPTRIELVSLLDERSPAIGASEGCSRSSSSRPRAAVVLERA